MRNFLLCLLLSLQLVAVKSQEVSKLPLTLKPKPAAKTIIFYLSGDGGMNSFSQALAQSLQEKNYAVICLDSRKYFWDQKTPDKLALDLNAAIAYYMKAWSKEQFALLGYSFGADASLLLTTRLPKDLLPKLQATILLSPSVGTDLVIKLTDMMGFGSKEVQYKSLSEINKINSKMLFVFGKDEDLDIYNTIPAKKNIIKMLIPGSHKFNNDSQRVVSTIQLVL